MGCCPWGHTESDTTEATQQQQQQQYKAVMSPCLLNFYAEYIMRNAKLDESENGIKISKRNVNNLRYADSTNFMAESEEEIKSLLMRVTEENEKATVKLNIQKTKITSGPITSWQIEGVKNGSSDRF